MKAFSYYDHNVEYHKEVLKYSFYISLAAFLLFIGYRIVTAPKNTFAKEKYFFNADCGEKNAGYVNKTNDLLNRSIVHSGIRQIDLDSLVNKSRSEIFFLGDSTLTFFLPEGGDIADLRLIGINKFLTKEDSLFYYNSLLPEHLLLQRKYPERNIFTVSPSFKEYKFINRITIDEDILSTSLISDNSFWQNKVMGNTDSIFKDYLFMRLTDGWLPIGEYTNYNSDIPFNPQNNPQDDSIDFIKHRDQFSLIKKALLDTIPKRSYSILVDDKSFQVTKIKDTLYIYSSELGDIEILHPKGTQVCAIRGSDKITVAIGKDPFEIKFKSSLKCNIGTIYCTPKNPFNNLSFMYFHNKYNSRYFASKHDVDLFSAILALKIPETENLFSKLSGGNKPSDIQISYNPIVAKYLEKEIADYRMHCPMLLNENYSVDKMGVTLMNTATGQVIALPWYSHSDSLKTIIKNLSNYNYVNHPIGSCFKPLLYLASFRRFPNLANLVITGDMVSSFGHFTENIVDADVDVRILGYPTRQFNGHTSGSQNLIQAVAVSSNLYPAMTFLYSVAENGSASYYNEIRSSNPLPSCLYRGLRNKHSTSCNTSTGKLCLCGLNKNDIATIYEKLYDIEGADIMKEDRDLFEYYFWDNSYCADANTQPNDKLSNYGSISPQKTTLRFDAFDKKHQKEGVDFRYEVVPWVLGSQNNRWNNVKLCEAFSRVITGMGMKGNFSNKMQNEISYKSLFDLCKPITTISKYPTISEFSKSHLALLNALNYRAQQTEVHHSTWATVGENAIKIHVDGMNADFVIFGKTGTPDDEPGDEPDDIIHRGLFTFTIMTEKDYEDLKEFIASNYDKKRFPKKLGITGVIALELQNLHLNKGRNYSPFALAFLTSERLKNIILLNKNCF